MVSPQNLCSYTKFIFQQILDSWEIFLQIGSYFVNTLSSIDVGLSSLNPHHYFEISTPETIEEYVEDSSALCI